MALAKAVTEVTHNHPEGIKGAEATTAAIFMALHGSSKEAIRTVIEKNYYKLDFTLDQIRPAYTFDVTCQGSVPQPSKRFWNRRISRMPFAAQYPLEVTATRSPRR